MRPIDRGIIDRDPRHIAAAGMLAVVAAMAAVVTRIPGHPAVLAKVHDAVERTLEDPQVKQKIEETGSDIIGNTPAEFAQQIRAECETYKKLAEEQKMKPE
jgi:tripartite-type tricarboxylate transporter receptor subunit TctC